MASDRASPCVRYTTFMNKVRAAGVIFEDEHGEILVLKRHPNDPEGTKWGIVGGKLEQNEDAATAARREVLEEAGYDINPKKLQLIGKFQLLQEELAIDFTAFVLPCRKDSVIMEIDPKHHTDHLWAKPKELYQRKDLMIGLYPILKNRYKLTP